jgi:conjugative relaxase-like TrwC/TraI family protein
VDHLSTSAYYLKGSGILQGQAFEHMGFSSREVDLEVFKALETNKHPETGRKITPRTNKTHSRWGIDRITGKRVLKDVAHRKSGMDITLVASKTLSMLIVEHPDEFGRKLEKVCIRAKDKAMTFAESLARMSVSGRGAFNERYTGNLLFLSVVHGEARAVGNNVADPYFHLHNYAFPVTYDPQSKRMMAVSMSHVLRYSEAIDALFVSEMEKGLTELGIGTTRNADNKGFEITSVEGKEIFCKRTAEINAQMRQEAALVDTITRFKVRDAASRGTHLDYEKTKNEVINGRSREFAKKKKPIEHDEQLAAWRAQMTPAIRASLSQEAVKAGQRCNWRTPEEAKEEVVFSAFKQDSVVHEYDIVAAMLRATGGAMSFDEALDFAKGPSFIHLDNRGHVTTQAVRLEERRMLEHARASWGTRQPLIKDPKRVIKDERVGASRDQKAAVRFIWDSRDGIMDVSGIAGAGKSSLLREAVPAIREEGHQVILLAPTSASEKNLKDDFPEAKTLQKFLTDLEIMPGIADDLVIFLDESSMVSVPQMARLVELVHSHGCRLVTLGDVDQHRSPERGDAIRILQGSKSVRSSELTETYRAQVAYLKETILDLKAGGIGCEIGFNRLDEHGDIREEEDIDKMREEAVQTHLEAVRKGDLAILASPTHVEGRLAAERVRNILKSEGRIEAEDHQVTRLENLNVEGPELRDLVHYQPGRVISFHFKVKGGFKCGDKWKIIDQDGAGFKVERRGEIKIFNPKTKGAWKIYEPSEMVLSVGDQVRITQGFWDRKVSFKNNDIAKIAAIDSERITLDDGRSMPRDYVHLDQGVCITSYATECRTVKQIVALTPCASLNTLDAKTFYVLASRATHKAIFYTDCKEALKEAALREGDRAAVWDYEKHSAPKPDGLDLQAGKRVTKVQRIIPKITPTKIAGHFQRLIASGMMRITKPQQEREHYVER